MLNLSNFTHRAGRIRRETRDALSNFTHHADGAILHGVEGAACLLSNFTHHAGRTTARRCLMLVP